MVSGPDLRELLALFPATNVRNDLEAVSAQAVPEPYQHLLVHPHHMTVTVEDHYGGPVSVRVLERHRAGNAYSRKIVLDHASAGTVLFGIVRIHLHECDAPVRRAIEEEKTPLGRILVEHNVHRRIEPTQFLRCRLGARWTSIFDAPASDSTYGRLGIIYCDHRPVIELLEILAPIPASA